MQQPSSKPKLSWQSALTTHCCQCDRTGELKIINGKYYCPDHIQEIKSKDTDEKKAKHSSEELLSLIQITKELIQQNAQMNQNITTFLQNNNQLLQQSITYFQSSQPVSNNSNQIVEFQTILERFFQTIVLPLQSKISVLEDRNNQLMVKNNQAFGSLESKVRDLELRSHSVQIVQSPVSTIVNPLPNQDRRESVPDEWIRKMVRIITLKDGWYQIKKIPSHHNVASIREYYHLFRYLQKYGQVGNAKKSFCWNDFFNLVEQQYPFLLNFITEFIVQYNINRNEIIQWTIGYKQTNHHRRRIQARQNREKVTHLIRTFVIKCLERQRSE